MLGFEKGKTGTGEVISGVFFSAQTWLGLELEGQDSGGRSCEDREEQSSR